MHDPLDTDDSDIICSTADMVVMLFSLLIIGLGILSLLWVYTEILIRVFA